MLRTLHLSLVPLQCKQSQLMVTVRCRRNSSAGNKDDSLALQSLRNCTRSVSEGKKVWVEEELRLSSSSPMRIHISKLQYFNTETCHSLFEGSIENSSLPQKRAREHCWICTEIGAVYSRGWRAEGLYSALTAILKPRSLFLSHEYLIIEK